MTEYTKGQRVRVLRDSTSSQIEPGTIVTLVDQNTDEFWYKERYGTCWLTDDTTHFGTGAVVSEDDIEPEDKFKPGDRVDWVYEDGRERADGYWSNVTVVDRDDFAGGGEAYTVRRENGDTGLIEASELRLHQDVVPEFEYTAPEGYEEVDVDRPEVGDIVTFTYLATDEEFTTTVHYGLTGLEMLGWGFFEMATFDDVADIEVTRVLRKVVPEEPEPEPEEPPVGSIVRFANGVYAYRVRRGYTEEFPEDHDWRSLYSDGSTGLDTWEATKRYSGDDGEFVVVREGGQGGDF
jgi:hypothetical protein